MPIIQAYHLAVLAIVGSVLCVLGIRKLPFLARSSMLEMFRNGLVAIAPALLLFGILYYRFTVSETDIQARQNLIRILLVYLFGSIDIWLIVILMRGKTL